MKGKTHDLNHDLTFSAHTINCVCHSIRSMFRVFGIYNVDYQLGLAILVQCMQLDTLTHKCNFHFIYLFRENSSNLTFPVIHNKKGQKHKWSVYSSSSTSFFVTTKGQLISKCRKNSSFREKY